MHVTTYTSFIDPNGNRTCATNMLCFGALHNNSPSATLSIATPFSVLDFNDLGLGESESTRSKAGYFWRGVILGEVRWTGH